MNALPHDDTDEPADYPAAHSMNVYWFAVDDSGEVAVFQSDDEGHVPDWDREFIYDMMSLFDFEVDLADGFMPNEWAQAMRLTYYAFPQHYDMLLHPYQRTARSKVPLHVDQLPPEFRAACRSVHFAGLFFAQTEMIQPLDFFDCTCRFPERRYAYVEVDGVTVRPLPGLEDEFTAFVEDFKRTEPRSAARLRFEGPPDPDFPAAHSMDTYWFAVDERGQVAAFETGEDGHAPNVKDNDVFSDIYALRFGPYDYDDNDGWDPEEWAILLGITFYRYPYRGDLLVLPYERTVIPAVPLHLDQLPHDLRWKCREVEFSMLSFAQFDTLQPLDVSGELDVTFDFWYSEQRPAYLCGDGMTVRPIRGSEENYARFVREHRHQYPEQYRFDGPTE